MSDKIKQDVDTVQKEQKGRPWCPSREKRPGWLLEKVEVLPLLARSMLETACRGGQGVLPGMLMGGGGVAADIWAGQGACRAGCVPLFFWQAGYVAGRRVGGAAGCKAGSVAGHR